jgi:hypothetical protein
LAVFTLTAIKAVLRNYKKKGFEVQQRRTLKHGKRFYLTRKKGGVSGFLGGTDGLYLFFVEGDTNTSNIRQFLKDYDKFYHNEGFDENDRGFFICSGKIDKGLFRDLRNALIEDGNVKRTIKTKSLNKTTTTRRTVKEERIKEKITEREITRKSVTEETITFELVLKEVKKFKRSAPKIRGRQKERLYTTALTGYLSHAFPSIDMEQSVGRGCRIDAMVGHIGIEAKYRPDTNEINRLYGQIDTYLQFLESIVVVFFDTSSDIVNDFRKKLKRGGYSKQIEIVNI